MRELTLPPSLSQQIAELYAEMQSAYDEVAGQIHFSCRNCPDNCCDSYFQHHTYIEWSYLWEGLRGLPASQLQDITDRAESCVQEVEVMLGQGMRPQVMCPLNLDGLCTLYSHRLMICRLHGVPATLSRPDGNILRFPGCFRCQELVGKATSGPALERADLYQRLAALEIDLLKNQGQGLPKIKLTLAQMLVFGPPRLP